MVRDAMVCSEQDGECGKQINARKSRGWGGKEGGDLQLKETQQPMTMVESDLILISRNS